MLVLVPGKVVDTVHISPVSNVGKVLVGVDLPSVWSSLDITTWDISSCNTACTFNGFLVVGGITSLVFRLREIIDGEIIQWVVLFIVSGLMPDSVRPGVLGSGPVASLLNTNVVHTLADAEETFLTPVGSPRVPYQPVFVAIFFTVANDGNNVDRFGDASVVAVNASSVVVKGLGHSDIASNGTSLVDLLHHVLLTRDIAEFVNTVDHVLVGHEASLTRVAVAANVHGRAFLCDGLVLFVSESAVDRAGLIGDLVVGHPLEGVVGVATMAAIVLLLAGDDDLGGNVDIRPGSLAGNLYPIRDGRGGCMGPAGAAVLGDVLIADVGDHVLTIDVVPQPRGGEVVSGHEGRVDAGLSSVEALDEAGFVKRDSAGVRSEGGDAHESSDSEGFHLKIGAIASSVRAAEMNCALWLISQDTMRGIAMLFRRDTM